ncbi:MAG: PolC-type DNA polymerase III [Anaerovoracaceae bacterium]
MKALFDGNIDWNELGGRKQEYVYSIEKVSLNKKFRILKIHLRLNFIIPIESRYRIEKLIMDEFTDLTAVDIFFDYFQMLLSPEEIIPLYMPYAIEELEEKDAPLGKAILPREFTYGGEGLSIMVLGDEAARELNDRVAHIFHKKYLDTFNISVNVCFSNKQDRYEEVLLACREKDILDSKEVSAKPSFADGKVADRKKGSGGGSGHKKVIGNLIMGKPIKGEKVKIVDLDPYGGTGIIIGGQVFQKEHREVKNGKILASLFIHDDTESVCCKCFTTKEKWEDIDSHIQEGTYLRLKGKAVNDSFENAVVVMVNDIEKETYHGRMDNAQEKRIELHAHTKMSALDGLNRVETLISKAAEWGHKAIAITDHGVVQAFPDAAKFVGSKGLDIKVIYGLEGYLLNDDDQKEGEPIDYKNGRTYHIIILAKNEAGLKNLYRLVSLSHMDFFYKRPRIPKSILEKHREGLIIGSACEAGEVFQSILEGLPREHQEKVAGFYDYLEIQPLINNRFMLENGRLADVEDLKEINRKIVGLGERIKKPVVATCDSHYTEPEDSVYRKIIMAGQGYKDAESGEGLFFRTTEEMLEEFSYLGDEVAREVVIRAPDGIAGEIEKLEPIPKGKFPPEIEDSDAMLRNRCMENAQRIYGTPLPPIVANRLERELSSIIDNGYAVLYISAEKLVGKSMEDGYLVGSRGSVGSSLAATMGGITEVNPLPPHYICQNPDCRNSEFPENTGFDCGVDLPPKNCPLCGEPYKRDGFNIPFEVFMGFEGNKEPDIDLNFAGEYQSVAHKYIEEIFGSENVFRAGTISTVAEKTAFGFVKKYIEETGRPMSKWEIDRLAKGCEGVRRTTGQHPGGIIILPRDRDIHDFCPVQRPANDMNSDVVTTHFEYHSIDENLLKLDILGHDVPSMIHMLQEMTGVDPLTLPLNDKRVQDLFNGIESLNIKDEDYEFTHGTFGIPEFGTQFVRNMLDDVKPETFADLVRISGFSHGTDVWLNNARDFILEGQATIKDAISTRDDIMNYLIEKGLPPIDSFRIMEKVRKGKGVSDEDVELMEVNKVPLWYIESCRRIKYMFPKAHAVAYVMMAYRIAYYKVYYPEAFYAAAFSLRCNDFKVDIALGGGEVLRRRLEELKGRGREMTQNEENEMSCLELVREMYARGFEFLPVDLERSHATKFQVIDGKIQIPFMAMDGMGENASKNLAEEIEKGLFFSIDDMKARARLNSKAIDALGRAGVLKGLPQSDQLSLF